MKINQWGSGKFRKLTAILLVILALTAGVGAQQSNVTNAIVIQALQAMGLFGTGYANGDVPVWSTASRRYLPSSTAGMTVTVNPSTCAAPAIRELGALTTGIAFTLTPDVQTCVSGTAYLTVNVGGARITNGGALGFSSGASAATDVVLAREGANQFFQKNGANSQRFSVANTYTSSSNYEAFSVDWQTVANQVLVGTRTAATGTARQLRLVAQNASGGNDYVFAQLQAGSPFLYVDRTTTTYGSTGATSATGNWYQFGGVQPSGTTVGSVNFFALLPIYNQVGSAAANTDLLINRTQTSVGSGTQLLIDAQVGSVSQWKVSNLGSMTTQGVLVMADQTVRGSSQPIVDTAQSWNNAGVTFTGWKLNVTNTASAAASMLLDLQVGGGTKFNVTRDGSGYFAQSLAAGNTTNNNPGTIRLDTGTVTASTPGFNVTQTWNQGGTNFIGLFANFTDTASAGGSLLLQLQTSSVNIFRVTKGGNLLVDQQTIGTDVETLSSVATNDDPTLHVLQGRAATTDATPTTINTLTIATSTSTYIYCEVVARRTGGASGAAEDGGAWIVWVAVKNTAGTVAEYAAETTTTVGESTAGFNVTAAPSGATELIQVTGAATTNLTWHSTCRSMGVNQ